MPPSDVCFESNGGGALITSDEECCFQSSSSGEWNDDDSTKTTTTTTTTTTATTTTTCDENDTDDELIGDCGVLPKSLSKETKAVRFDLNENQVQVFEYDKEERASMWYTPWEKRVQRREMLKAVRLLQDYADYNPSNDDGVSDTSMYPCAEAIANKNFTSTRGLEHGASSCILEETRQRLENVRLSVLNEQKQELRRLLASERDEAIAMASRRASASATTWAWAKAHRDAQFVQQNVVGGTKDSDV